jgi:hypothetical protein
MTSKLSLLSDKHVQGHYKICEVPLPATTPVQDVFQNMPIV